MRDRRSPDHWGRDLRPSADDPVDVVVTDQGLCRGVGIGRLAVVDEAHAVDGRDQFLAMREARIALQAGDRFVDPQAERPANRMGCRGVLPVVVPGRLGMVLRSTTSIGFAPMASTSLPFTARAASTTPTTDTGTKRRLPSTRSHQNSFFDGASSMPTIPRLDLPLGARINRFDAM